MRQEPKNPTGARGPEDPEAVFIQVSPQVRGELRAEIRGAIFEALRDIVSDLLPHPPLGAPGQAAPAVAPIPAAAAAPTAPAPPVNRSAQNRGDFPFAHGDIDLGFIPANVPSAEQRRPRRGGGRQPYFLEGGRGNPAVRPQKAPPKTG